MFTFILTVILVMPPDKDDVQQSRQMASLGMLVRRARVDRAGRPRGWRCWSCGRLRSHRCAGNQGLKMSEDAVRFHCAHCDFVTSKRDFYELVDHANLAHHEKTFLCGNRGGMSDRLMRGKR